MLTWHNVFSLSWLLVIVSVQVTWPRKFCSLLSIALYRLMVSEKKPFMNKFIFLLYIIKHNIWPVCVCTVELSIELPWRDSWRGEGAPLIVMQRPGPRTPAPAPAPKKAPAPDVTCFAPTCSESAVITVTRGVGWLAALPVTPPTFLYTSFITTSRLPPCSPNCPPSKLVCTCMLFCCAPPPPPLPPLAELRELSRLRHGVEVTEEAERWPPLPPRPCTPSSLGPPCAMVEQVEDCREVTRDTLELPPAPAPGPTCSYTIINIITAVAKISRYQIANWLIWYKWPIPNLIQRYVILWLSETEDSMWPVAMAAGRAGAPSPSEARLLSCLCCPLFSKMEFPPAVRVLRGSHKQFSG